MQGQVITPEPFTANYIILIILYMTKSAIHTRLNALADMGLLKTDHHLTPQDIDPTLKSKATHIPASPISSSKRPLISPTSSKIASPPLNQPTSPPRPLFHAARQTLWQEIKVRTDKLLYNPGRSYCPPTIQAEPIINRTTYGNQ